MEASPPLSSTGVPPRQLARLQQHFVRFQGQCGCLSTGFIQVDVCEGRGQAHKHSPLQVTIELFQAPQWSPIMQKKAWAPPFQLRVSWRSTQPLRFECSARAHAIDDEALECLEEWAPGSDDGQLLHSVQSAEIVLKEMSGPAGVITHGVDSKFTFDNLQFRHPSMMRRRWMLFSIQLPGDAALCYTLFRLPTIVMSRHQNQLQRAEQLLAADAARDFQVGGGAAHTSASGGEVQSRQAQAAAARSAGHWSPCPEGGIVMRGPDGALAGRKRTRAADAAGPASSWPSTTSDSCISTATTPAHAPPLPPHMACPALLGPGLGPATQAAMAGMGVVPMLQPSASVVAGAAISAALARASGILRSSGLLRACQQPLPGAGPAVSRGSWQAPPHYGGALLTAPGMAGSLSSASWQRQEAVGQAWGGWAGTNSYPQLPTPAYPSVLLTSWSNDIGEFQRAEAGGSQDTQTGAGGRPWVPVGEQGYGRAPWHSNQSAHHILQPSPYPEAQSGVASASVPWPFGSTPAMPEATAALKSQPPPQQQQEGGLADAGGEFSTLPLGAPSLPPPAIPGQSAPLAWLPKHHPWPKLEEGVLMPGGGEAGGSWEAQEMYVGRPAPEGAWTAQLGTPLSSPSESHPPTLGNKQGKLGIQPSPAEASSWDQWQGGAAGEGLDVLLQLEQVLLGGGGCMEVGDEDFARDMLELEEEVLGFGRG